MLFLRSLGLALFPLLIAFPVGAGDDIEVVSALWSDFVSALHRGDYPRAYGLFSAESRSVMPYDGFIREYGPLTLALEMVLAKPENRSTRLEGEWAELTYGGVRPGTGGPFRVVAAAVRNHGSWSLVAGRNEVRERTEAAARSLLLSIAGLKNLPDARERAVGMATDAASTPPILRQYRFDLGGPVFKAIPLIPGLRAFHLDAWGQVRQGESPVEPRPDGPAVPETNREAEIRELGPIPELDEAVGPPPAAIPTPERRPATVDGIPELAEPDVPPGFGIGGEDIGEMPEPQPSPLFDYPDMAPTDRRSTIPNPERIELPDVIGQD